MAAMGEDIRERTDALDAAGNTTAAIGKGYAIGSAALVSLALFGAYVTRADISVKDSSILDPEVTLPKLCPGQCTGEHHACGTRSSAQYGRGSSLEWVYLLHAGNLSCTLGNVWEKVVYSSCMASSQGTCRAAADASPQLWVSACFAERSVRLYVVYATELRASALCRSSRVCWWAPCCPTGSAP